MSPDSPCESSCRDRPPVAWLAPFFVLVALLVLARVQGAEAATLNGRFGTSLYSFEGQKTDTTSASFLRSYQSLRLELGALGPPELSFHSYVQGTTDLGREADSDPRLRLYSAYLRWRARHYSLQAGRQRVYAGVGFGSIDGFSGTLSLPAVELLLYAGALVPLHTSTDINSWSSAHLWGGRISTELFDTAFSLSFAHHEREPEPYDGRLSGHPSAPDAVVRRLIGVDVLHRFAAGHSVYGRLDYDTRDEEVRRSEFEVRYALSPRLSLQGEWLRRRPYVFYNSIFSVFPSEAFNEVGGRLYYRLNPALQLGAHFATVLYDDAHSRRFGFTAGLGSYCHLGYYRSSGYARASDGLVGSIHYPLGSRLLLRSALDLGAYERYDDAGRNALLTGTLGLNYHPNRRTFVEAEVQGLRNPLYASDLRLLLRASWRFFEGSRR